MKANSNAAMIATADELADIENILADLDAPIAGVLDAAEIEPGTIIEEAHEPLAEAEAAEIAATVAEIELDATTDEIELEATDVTPVVEIGAIDEADIAAAAAALERQEAMEEHYAEQPALEEDASIAPAEQPAPGEKKARAPREPKAKTPKTPAAPKATLASLADAAFVLDMNEEPADLAANKEAVIRRRPEQVKVGEKFDNTLLALAAGKLPSTYTVDCYRVLKNAGRASSAALAAALTSTSKKQDTSATYTIGTARSQAGQFMALAPALKIATRDGKDLVLNPDSTIAAALDVLLGL